MRVITVGILRRILEQTKATDNAEVFLELVDGEGVLKRAAVSNVAVGHRNVPVGHRTDGDTMVGDLITVPFVTVCGSSEVE